MSTVRALEPNESNAISAELERLALAASPPATHPHRKEAIRESRDRQIEELIADRADKQSDLEAERDMVLDLVRERDELLDAIEAMRALDEITHSQAAMERKRGDMLREELLRVMRLIKSNAIYDSAALVEEILAKLIEANKAAAGMMEPQL